MYFRATEPVSQPAKRNPDSTEALIKKLRDYEVVKLLGRGGMGIVYLVRHSLTKRIEVLKVLRPSLSSRPRLRERFLREVQVAAKLDHPNVVKTFTAIQNEELLGLVMEYVVGKDLESLVRDNGPLSVQSAVSIIRQAALGLQHASSHGLTHRDVKPSNILVTRVSGEIVAKLSDFGLSKIGDEPTNNGLTIDGRILGTPDYMAPEQGLDPANATIAADIYGLGCSLYYALVGSPPYSGASPMSVLNMHIQAAVPNAALFRSDIPDELSRILARMLQKDPRDRFATPADVADSLLPLTLSDYPTAPRPQSSDPEVVPVLAPNISDGLSIDAGALATQTQSTYRRHNAGVRSRPKKPTSIASSVIQFAIPTVSICFVLLYLRPWNVGSASHDEGTLLVRDLSAGTSIEIDGKIKVASDVINNQLREIRLAAGTHRLKFLDDETVVMERTVEIKPHATVELSLAYTGARSRPNRHPVRPPSAPRPDKNPAGQFEAQPETAPPMIADLQIAPTEVVASAHKPPVREKSLELPKTKLVNQNWAVELERQLSGLQSNPQGILILPRDVTALGNELVIATGRESKAWDAKTGVPQDVAEPFPVTGIVVANNEKSVLYFNDFKCEVWTVQKPKPKKWFWTPENFDANRVFAMSLDSRYLACCDHDETFVRWELASRKVVGTMTAKHPLTKDNVQLVSITAKLDKVLTVGIDGRLTCWDASDGEQLGSIAARDTESESEQVIDLYVDNSARTAIVIRKNGNVETRKIPTLELVNQVKVSDEQITASACSSHLLAVANSARTVTLLETSAYAPVGTIDCPDNLSVSRIALSDDSRCVAVAYDSGLVHVTRLKKSRPTSLVNEPPKVEISPASAPSTDRF